MIVIDGVSTPSSVSFAVAPDSVYVPPSGKEIFPLPISVIVGTHPVMTFTVRIAPVDTFPAASVYPYDNVYVPSAPVLTVPLATSVPDQSIASVQLAPRSVYTVPRVTFRVDGPFRVITAGVLSATITVLVTCGAELPEVSCTSYVTVYVPGTLLFTGLTVTILDVRSPSWRSDAVAPASTYGVQSSWSTVASPSRVIFGTLPPTTSTVLVTCTAAFHCASVTL